MPDPSVFLLKLLGCIEHRCQAPEALDLSKDMTVVDAGIAVPSRTALLPIPGTHMHMASLRTRSAWGWHEGELHFVQAGLNTLT